MSFITEWVLKKLILVRERVAGVQGTASRSASHVEYFQWQYSSSAKLFSHYQDFEPKDKTILEIGCGIGGRTAWLASTGATRVVGVDINSKEIDVARSLAQKFHPELTGCLEYYASNEHEILDIGQFDYVLLVDSIEHVVSPPAILRLAYQYTRSGGRCYFNTIGWFHPVGSHMPMIPWVNVFFSDETILNVMRWKVSRPQYVASRFDSNPPIERWRGIYDLRDRPGEHLNKITIQEIKRLVRHTIFRKAEWKIIGFQAPKLAPLNIFSKIPILQEMFHSGIVVKMEK